MTSPVICFGQQPCGFFPRRFLLAKLQTARRLQACLGGEIVFFFHDSDHDYRETRTSLRLPGRDAPLALNFAFENKVQRKFSPLYLKRIAVGWQEQTARLLAGHLETDAMAAFRSNRARTVADFCLEMYRRLGLLEGVRVVRSGDPLVRVVACDIVDHFVDVEHEGEVVRARSKDGVLSLHQGGNSYLHLPPVSYGKAQISPTRDSRLRWMQSVIGCTHYVNGAGEQAYLNTADVPEIRFIPRDAIEHPDEAFTYLPR
jgi:hypothetical protein